MLRGNEKSQPYERHQEHTSVKMRSGNPTREIRSWRGTSENGHWENASVEIRPGDPIVEIPGLGNIDIGTQEFCAQISLIDVRGIKVTSDVQKWRLFS